MSTSQAPPRGRPGRPRTASEPTGPQARVAWLLRSHRLSQPHEAWLRGSEFAHSFPGGCHPEQVTPSTVSRWETGAVRATFKTLSRYEQLAALPPGLLVAVADVLYRCSSPAVTAAPTLTRQPTAAAGSPTHAALDDLLERALNADPRSGVLTGQHWDALTAILASSPAVVLAPRQIWSELAARLFEELVAAERLPWIQRFEAFQRLLGHREGHLAAVAACAEASTSPVGSPLDRDMMGRVLDQLAHPADPRTRHCALLTCLAKVHFGQFVALRPSGPPAGAGRVCGSVVSASLTAAHEHGHVDHVLPVLIDELLFHPAGEVRVNAALLLYASPHAATVAAAIAAELVRGRARADAALGPPLIRALRLIGGAQQRPVVEQLVLAPPGVPREVSDAAVHAIGHLDGSSSDHFWWRAISHHRDAWRGRHDGGTIAALRALVYGLGLARNTPLLRRVRYESDVPEVVRAAAGWWLARSSRLYASVSPARTETGTGASRNVAAGR
jgi:hypothetical protein